MTKKVEDTLGCLLTKGMPARSGRLISTTNFTAIFRVASLALAEAVLLAVCLLKRALAPEGRRATVLVAPLVTAQTAKVARPCCPKSEAGISTGLTKTGRSLAISMPPPAPKAKVGNAAGFGTPI